MSLRHFGEKNFSGDIWLDENNLREDRVYEKGSETVREARCRTADELIYWTSDTLDGNGGVAVHRYRAELASKQIGWLPLDLRLVGLDPNDTGKLRSYALKPFESVAVGSLDRSNAQITSITWEGRSASEVTFEKANGVQIRIITSPDVGNNVLLCEAIGDSGGRSVARCQYELDRDTQIWVPSEFVFEQTDSAGEIVMRERTQISFENINEPIDPQVFTLAGLDIPKGKLITTLPTTAQPDTYWDGEKEVAARPIQLARDDEGGTPLWAYRVAIVVCVIIAAGCVWVYARKRR